MKFSGISNVDIRHNTVSEARSRFESKRDHLFQQFESEGQRAEATNDVPAKRRWVEEGKMVMKIQILWGRVVREYADLSYLLVAWESNLGFVVE